MAEKTSYEDLHEKIDFQISQFSKKRKSHRRMYEWLSVCQIVTGIGATFVLGLSVSPEGIEFVKNFALALTSATTISTLILAHFQHKDHYISFTWVVSQLRQLKSELEFRQKLAIEKPTTGLDKTALEDLHLKFSAILSESNSEWKSRMKQPVAPVHSEQG